MPTRSSLRSALTGLLPSTLLALTFASSARAGEVYSKPPGTTGEVNLSSWVAPDGSDSDMYAWDDFTLATTQTITEVRWRGGYAYAAYYGGHANDFRISFFDSIAGGFQPLITALPEDGDNEVTIATFQTGNNAGETAVGVFGGVAMYDYRFVLPTPVTLTGGVKYWLRIVASQPGYPDWGLSSSPVGDGGYFRYVTGYHMFQNAPHNLSFGLVARWEDVGSALAGSAGAPRLTGSGTLAPGTSGALTLANSRPSSAAVLVLGLARFDRPLLGGVLVPAPQVRVPLATSAAGGASWPFTLPASLASGTNLHAQAWIRDPIAPQGWAASNAQWGTTP